MQQVQEFQAISRRNSGIMLRMTQVMTRFKYEETYALRLSVLGELIILDTRPQKN